MNNSQFRNLVQNDRSSKTSPGPNDVLSGATPSFKTPMLGSRARTSVPMTPRSVAGHNHSRDFARQISDHKQEHDGEPPSKKFKSIAAPKGTRLARGYNDRTQQRRGEAGEETQDDKQKRVQALEEMLKLQQIDLPTFEKLRDEIGVGGDLGSTHLIKGLDWKLLQRIKKGEDVNGKAEEAKNEEQKEEAEDDTVDVDDELDNALERDVATSRGRDDNVAEDQASNQDQNTEVLTRDEILRRLKESRGAAAPTRTIPEPNLSDRFKKVSSDKKSGKQKFTETINGRRREVLVITEKDGNTKRKTRWLDPEPTVPAKKAAKQEPLGMDVPAEFAARLKAMKEQEAVDEADDDIFQGVGADYDPLRDLESDSDTPPENSTMNEDEQPKENATTNLPTKPRNYFSNKDAGEETNDRQPIAEDQTIMAAIKRAAQLRQAEAEDRSGDAEGDINPEQAARHKKFLDKLKQQERADAEDLDMGFGESRFGDDGEDDEPIWADDGGDEEGNGQQKKTSRKRGAKKRKGDKDSVADVMSVLEGRKKG